MASVRTRWARENGLLGSFCLKYLVESLTIVFESYASTIATFQPLPPFADFTP
jgi:hypothetical protein